MKIARTGGIACGKSKVSQLFKKLGAKVISLDELSRQVVMPDIKVLNKLIERFGDGILNA
jgi:dephospho-CoA kinase